MQNAWRAGLGRGWQGPLAMERIVTGCSYPTSISKLGLPLSELHRPRDRPRGGRGGWWAAQVHPEAFLPREAEKKHSGISIKKVVGWRGRLENPQGEERVEGGGQESCHPALTSPLNFKVALHSGMLGKGGDLAPTLLLSAVVLLPRPCWREESG